MTNYGGAWASIVSTANYTVTGTIAVGSEPIGVTFTHNGTTAYVTSQGTGTVDVIHTANQTVIGTISVGFQPVSVAISPDGGTAYVVNPAPSADVSLFSTANGTVLGTIAVGSAPYNDDVALTPDGIDIRPSSSTPPAIPSASLRPPAKRSLPPSPSAQAPTSVSVAPGGGTAFVTNYASGTISTIDTDTATP